MGQQSANSSRTVLPRDKSPKKHIGYNRLTTFQALDSKGLHPLRYALGRLGETFRV